MRICVLGANSAIAQEYIRHRKLDEILVMDNRERPCLFTEPIDVMVTFPGVVKDSTLIKMTHQDWDEVVENTLSSVAKGLMHGLNNIQDGGAVVVVGSIVGSMGGYGCANYAAAKAGLVGLVRAASNEVASRKVRVNLLELGYVDAGMGTRLAEKVRKKIIKTIPLKRFAETKEVLHAIDFLTEQTYMTGEVLRLSGGLR